MDKIHVGKIGFISPHIAYGLLRSPNSVLLESQKNGRYSYIALNPIKIFKSKGMDIEITEKGVTTQMKCNPIDELRKTLGRGRRKKGLPLFYSGAIGYIGYDIVHFFEKLPKTAKDDLDLPDIYLIFPRDILFFDHLKKTAKILSKTKKGLDEVVDRLKKPVKKKENQTRKSVKFKSNYTKKKYFEAVKRCREYVRAGDSFQIKISQRFECEVTEDPYEVYLRLRRINPSPYGAYLDLDGVTLVSCSPEHLVKVEKGNVETRPIGGTYPRGKNKREDLLLAKKFMSDEKEKSEHTMLIDLERNDLGRVCKCGSLKVNELMALERYSHLMHIVTNIMGRLAKGMDVFDVLKAMFPGGTITGCPKIRTMEIIDEVEPNARGPYTGSIGFITPSDEMDLNIIIRTLIVKDGRGYIQVGGGIVADSNPEREYQETFEKAYALFEAVEGGR
ncbi:MAG: anthranilate synthase component I family protein [Candidatus Altiarchaeota archaeon]|nr:anthranilate synthase component I family protein [Candidatus Altiarchaeota archaeon]